MRRWFGIPYAEPVRWGPPVPIPWIGDAGDRFGPSAPQRTESPLLDAVPGMRVAGPMDEAGCLTLNVWAPDLAEGLPVLVWVHGGAYVIGGSSLPTYDGTRLAERGLVVVSCNYRLGALGGVGGNWRLLDQQAALRWVQHHIGDLGGDPGNVTVMGESAGAGCLLHQLGSPGADGLFRRAILQSPGAEVIRKDAAESLTAAFHEALDGRVEVAAIVEAEQAAEVACAHLFGSMPWAPYVDGEVLPASPQERVAAGGAAGVEVLVSGTASELGLFSGQLRGLPDEAVAGVLRHLLRPVLGRDPGGDAVLDLVAAYADDDDPVTTVLSDAAMTVPHLRLLDDLARHQASTFAYVFDWPVPELGACHAADLPFTFGTFDVAGWRSFVGADGEAERVSQEIGDAIAAFARTGDPGWPAWDERRRANVFGPTTEVRRHPTADRLERHEVYL